jgi:hypothetical protein
VYILLEYIADSVGLKGQERGPDSGMTGRVEAVHWMQIGR